jgi:hypothetical protein
MAGVVSAPTPSVPSRSGRRLWRGRTPGRAPCRRG